MKEFLFFILLFFSLTACSDKDLKSDYIKKCGSENSELEAFCLCSYEYLQDQYTENDLKKIIKNYDKETSFFDEAKKMCSYSYAREVYIQRCQQNAVNFYDFCGCSYDYLVKKIGQYELITVINRPEEKRDPDIVESIRKHFLNSVLLCGFK